MLRLTLIAYYSVCYLINKQYIVLGTPIDLSEITYSTKEGLSNCDISNTLEINKGVIKIVQFPERPENSLKSYNFSLSSQQLQKTVSRTRDAR